MPLFPVITPTDVSALSRESTQLEVAEKSLWVPGVDSSFWPCVSGEDEPPTFDTGAGYATFGGLPSVFSISGAAGVNWPGKPRAREDRPVMRIQFFETTDNDADLAGRYRKFSYGTTGLGPGVELRVEDNASSANKRVTLLTTDAAGVTQTTGPQSLGIVKDEKWHAWEIRLLNNRVELYFDFALVLTHSTRYWPSAVGASTYAMNWYMSAGMTGYLSQLSVKWEKETWLAA